MGHDLHSLLAAGPRLGTGTGWFLGATKTQEKRHQLILLDWHIEVARKNKKIVFLGHAKAGMLLKTQDNLENWPAKSGWKMGKNEAKTARF